MRYEVGDEVIIKIKRWEEIKREYISYFGDSIVNCIDKYLPSRIVTIRQLCRTSQSKDFNRYRVKEIDNILLADELIECLFSEYKEEVFDPILSRWEILDIR